MAHLEGVRVRYKFIGIKNKGRCMSQIDKVWLKSLAIPVGRMGRGVISFLK
jgi:hypothetical protein